jgi:hypothetical protein
MPNKLVTITIRCNGPKPWVAVCDGAKDKETGYWIRRFFPNRTPINGILTLYIPDKDAVYDICFGKQGYRKTSRSAGPSPL